MIVTEYTRRALAYRKESRDMILAGWERIHQGSNILLKMHNGGRWRERIVDVRIAVDGKSLWVKIEECKKP